MAFFKEPKIQSENINDLCSIFIVLYQKEKSFKMINELLFFHKTYFFGLKKEKELFWSLSNNCEGKMQKVVAQIERGSERPKSEHGRVRTSKVFV